MKAFVYIVIVLIFIVSVSIMVAYNSLGFGIMASTCIWSFIYFVCNYTKPKGDNLSDRWSE
jgi:hypothetical protein